MHYKVHTFFFLYIYTQSYGGEIFDLFNLFKVIIKTSLFDISII